MLYNYYFDIAALISGLFLLTVYIIRKSLSTRSNKLLHVLIVVCVLGSFFDVISCFSISYPDRYPMWFNYLTCYGYLFFYNLMGVLFFAYIDSKTKIAKIFSFVRNYVRLITLIEFLLIFTSPFTRLVSYFDESKTYLHGPLMYFLYVMAAFHLLASALMFVKERRRFNRYQVMAIVAFIVVVFLGVLIQIIVPSLLVGQFGCSLVLFFIYTSLENPVYYTYRGTTCYNRRAFFEVMKMKLHDKDDISILAISIKDFDNYMESLSYKDVGRMSSVIAEWLHDYHRENAFSLADDKFVVFLKEKDDVEKIINRIKEYFTKPVQVVDSEVMVSVSTVYIPNINKEKKADLIEDCIGYIFEKVRTLTLMMLSRKFSEEEIFQRF